MKSFVALSALSALVNAVPDPQLLGYPLINSGFYRQPGLLPVSNYQPLTRYINGAAVPVEPLANQKAKLEHYKAKAEEYEKKGYQPYVSVHPIYKREAEAEPEPFYPYGLNYAPAVYQAPTYYSHAYANPAVVTYKQEIDNVETPADTLKVSYKQKVIASPFYSGLGYTIPVYEKKEEEKKSVEKRDADSQVFYPNLYTNGVYHNAPLYHPYNAFNTLPVNNVINSPVRYIQY